MRKIPLTGYTGAPTEEIKFPRPVQNEVYLRHAHMINARGILAPAKHAVDTSLLCCSKAFQVVQVLRVWQGLCCFGSLVWHFKQA